MKEKALSWVDKLIDWFIRPKNLGLQIFRISIGALIAVGGGGFAINLAFQAFSIDVSVVDAVPSWITYSLIILLLTSAVIGLILALFIYTKQHKERSNAANIVIEGRGLASQEGFPLSEQIKGDISGRIHPIFLDLRQGDASKISDPHLLVPKILSLKESVLQSVRGVGREHANLIYGGLTAVPFTFLTGLEIDDEIAITIYDWDRFQERWRLLDEYDDGARFTMKGEEILADSPEEVVLAVSVSYKVEMDNISSTFRIPVIELVLDGYSADSHWSAEKQSELSKQFLQVAKLLSENRVKKIHLVLAAPNSVVFRFGRNYDKRNLPDINVYQFEYANEGKKYPWSVAMNAGSNSEAEIVFT